MGATFSRAGAVNLQPDTVPAYINRGVGLRQRVDIRQRVAGTGETIPIAGPMLRSWWVTLLHRSNATDGFLPVITLDSSTVDAGYVTVEILSTDTAQMTPGVYEWACGVSIGGIPRRLFQGPFEVKP